ncbi:MAG: hypothetical protein ACRD2T_16420, partial [Thermoanaerobaculia bacterium]
MDATNGEKETCLMSGRLAAVCVFALALVLCALSAAADPGRGGAIQCYVWANQPTSAIGAPYTPST